MSVDGTERNALKFAMDASQQWAYAQTRANHFTRGHFMPNLIKVRLEEGAPYLQRILLKNVLTRDDLDQVFLVIRASIAEGANIYLEVYEEIKLTEMNHAKTA